ncbi:MAG TPA: VWA domain-containing protein, partial [Vicinamibacterales bacterium]|nr:VWA domain-containing protein [Vicinamibacterales bacterium]
MFIRACTIALLALGTIVLAQDVPAPQFKSESELVVLHVMVTDRAGGYVTGLAPDAFRVLDETQPQTPRFFLNEDAPVTVGLILDSSGSMAPFRDRVIAAATEFVESSNREDEVFALVFDDDVQPVLRKAPFTSDPEELRGALSAAFRPGGRTALYDAVMHGLRYASKGTQDRRVLVVLSDGGDNTSDATFKDVTAAVQGANTVIYGVALDDPFDPDSNPKRLRQLAEISGGESFTPKDVGEVRKTFQKIARDIRHSYTIGFEP